MPPQILSRPRKPQSDVALGVVASLSSNSAISRATQNFRDHYQTLSGGSAAPGKGDPT